MSCLLIAEQKKMTAEIELTTDEVEGIIRRSNGADPPVAIPQNVSVLLCLFEKWYEYLDESKIILLWKDCHGDGPPLSSSSPLLLLLLHPVRWEFQTDLTVDVSSFEWPHLYASCSRERRRRKKRGREHWKNPDCQEAPLPFSCFLHKKGRRWGLLNCEEAVLCFHYAVTRNRNRRRHFLCGGRWGRGGGDM